MSQSQDQSQTASGLRLGVDVGGTFTDLLLLDETGGKTYTAKVPSTKKPAALSCRTHMLGRIFDLMGGAAWPGCT